MRAYFLLFCIIFLTLNSCKKETLIDCSKCDSKIIVSTSDNTFTSENIYSYFIYSERDALERALEEGKNNTAYLKLQQKKDCLNLKKYDLNLFPKLRISTGSVEEDEPCVFCPNESECCLANWDYFMNDQKSNFPLNIEYNNKDAINLGNGKKLIPVKSLNGYNEETKILSFELTDLNGVKRPMQIQFK